MLVLVLLTLPAIIALLIIIAAVAIVVAVIIVLVTVPKLSGARMDSQASLVYPQGVRAYIHYPDLGTLATVHCQLTFALLMLEGVVFL